jgi:hypothetical protein
MPLAVLPPCRLAALLLLIAPPPSSPVAFTDVTVLPMNRPGVLQHQTVIARADVPTYLASGILTVRNMWGHDGITRLQADIAAGRLDGPTIYSLSPGLDASPGFWPFTQFVDDAAKADSVVAVQQAAGWTTIKVYQRLSAAAFDSIVASVRRRQLRFAGHVPTAVSIGHALATGMESIEHYTGYDRAVSRSGKGGTFGWADADTSRLAAYGAGDVVAR